MDHAVYALQGAARLRPLAPEDLSGGLPQKRSACLVPAFFEQGNWVRFAKTGGARHLLPLLLWRLPKPNARSTTVLVDEFDASFLKRSSYDIKGRATWLAPLVFDMVDGHEAHARSIS